MAKDYTYCLYLLDARGEKTPVLEHVKSARRVRNVAKGLKERPGRQVLITRDGKRMRGARRRSVPSVARRAPRREGVDKDMELPTQLNINGHRAAVGGSGRTGEVFLDAKNLHAARLGSNRGVGRDQGERREGHRCDVAAGVRWCGRRGPSDVAEEMMRGCSSAGRALPSQGRSQGFDSPQLHMRPRRC